MDSTQQPKFTQFTQSSQKVRISADSIILEFVKRDRAIHESNESKRCDIEFVQNYYKQLSLESRRSRLFLAATIKTDNGEYFSKFISAWLNLLKFCDEEYRDGHRMAAVQAILTEYETKNGSVHNFVAAYNSLTAELSQLPDRDLSHLVQFISERVKSEKGFLKRWRDCLHVLLCHLLKKKLDVPKLIQELMKETRSTETFRHVVSVAKDFGLLTIVEKCFLETLLNGIKEEEKRFESTWKTLCLLEHLDVKLIARTLQSVVTVWAGQSACNPDLFTVLPLWRRILEDGPVVGKAFSTLLKSQPGVVLTSQFGLLTLLLLFSIERYKVQTTQEVKKILTKLWRFEEEIDQFGWLKEAEAGITLLRLKEQIDLLLDYFDMNGFKDLWSVVGLPLVHLGYSLLTCPASKTVTVLEGKVTEDGKMWLFAKSILIQTLLSNTEAIASQLETIVQAIGASGSNGSALCLIDVLVEIVKKCSMEVLNNCKVLDGLFDYVCKMKRDVAVALVKCLLPIINQRSKLREALFKSLKIEMLNESSVSAAIPILILLLRSVSRKKCLTADSAGSQSFASFSTQSLQELGLKPSADDSVALEIIGILKRALTQPSSTKILLYEGLSDAVRKSSSLVCPSLDLLTSHALTTSEGLSPDSLVLIETVQLRESLPHLAQAIDQLCVEALTSSAGQVADTVVQKASQVLNKWIERAVRDGISDFGIDKHLDWNTPAGRPHLVFANMMVQLYDVLIEHLWGQFDALKGKTDKDNLLSLLKRRADLEDILAEKVIKKKNTQDESCLASSHVIAGILETLVTRNSDEIEELREELLEWTVDRAVALSKDLTKSSHQPRDLSSVARNLLTFYTGENCPEWMKSIGFETLLKTKTAESYSNVIRYLSRKYRSDPSKLTVIWSGSETTGSVSQSLVKHVHFLMTKIFPELLAVDKEEGKKGAIFVERQAKYLIQSSIAILSATNSAKAAQATFKFLAKTMFSNSFVNASTLKDFLKLLEYVGFRCFDSDGLLKQMKVLTEDVGRVLNDEVADVSCVCVTNQTVDMFFEHLMLLTERLLDSTKELVLFAREFVGKNEKMDELLSIGLEKIGASCGILSPLLDLHIQFNAQKERFVVLLTTFFSTVEAPVDLMLHGYKAVPEMSAWQTVTILAELLTTKVQAIMAGSDENVGLLCPGETAGNAKRKKAKVKKEENIYVNYVKARESLQSNVLQLSKAFKDDRLNLQIKGNSIGIRDFRIDMRVLQERIANEPDEEPTPKRKKRTSVLEEADNEDQNKSTVY